MADMTETQVEAHYSELIELVRAGRMSYYDKAAELARRNGLSIAPLWRVREEGVNNQLG